jgi:hypothetical protein
MAGLTEVLAQIENKGGNAADIHISNRKSNFHDQVSLSPLASVTDRS